VSAKGRIKKAIGDDWHQCADCGRWGKRYSLLRKKAKVRLFIHHIVPTSEGGSDKMENLVVICGFCHRQRHEKMWMEKYGTVPASNRRLLARKGGNNG